MARASDSAKGCRSLQSPGQPKALHTTRTPSVFPASSPYPPPSSNPARQTTRSHSTHPSAFPELLSSSQSKQPPALPTSPCPVSRFSPSVSLPTSYHAMAATRYAIRVYHLFKSITFSAFSDSNRMIGTELDPSAGTNPCRPTPPGPRPPTETLA